MKARSLPSDVLTAVVLFMAFVTAVYWLSSDRSDSDSIRRGLQQLRDIDWQANRQTLVMAIRPGCHYCSASAAFYRDIVGSDSTRAVHLLAVSPASVESTRSYLRTLGVGVTDVRQTDLATLGVEGTPTLVLVDSRGRVQAQWVGQLDPGAEAAVFRAMQVIRLPAHKLNAGMP